MSTYKNPFAPIYLQISEEIKSQILSGEYREGDRLPSESEFISKYKVTRTTIQRALAVLVNEGLIERIHGKGSFVRLRSVRQNIWNFSGFSDYAKKMGQIPITKVIRHETYIHQKVKYLKLIRLRGFEKNEKIQWLTLDTSVLSLADFPGLDRYDFSKQSMYETLKSQYNIHPSNAHLSVSAIVANDQLMDLFEVEAGSPLLNVKGETFDKNGKEVEKVNVVYSPKADFNFVINI
ncbi:GntR family transcriptional regulator [Bacillus sp. FJAT-27245]|uniref:GntR family transcriptional regulator n=1 Tax=Bacillus sp. FJAT-27245 TaxID=1684144 RepID=UPI0006A7BFEF|nr:GntR family transcriptional regulator [Bacillus sp. FJAT-27245]